MGKLFKYFLQVLAVVAAIVSCRPEPCLTLSLERIELSENGGDYVVGVSSAYPWTVTIEYSPAPSPTDWIVITKTSETEAYVNILPNDGLDPRSARCRFEGNGAVAYLTVLQDAPEILDVNDEKIIFDAEAGTTELRVTSNVEISASCDANWVTVQVDAIDHGAVLTLTAKPNYSVMDRITNLKISGGSLNRTIKVLQTGYTSSDYSMDKTVTVWQETENGRGGNFVIIGDGFSDRMIADGTYESVIRKTVDALFVQEPYGTLRDMLNVYSITAVSPNEGIGNGGKTALGCYFYGDRMAYGDLNKCIDYALLAVDEDAMDETVIIAVLNSPKYAGVAQWFYPDNDNDYGSGLCIAFFAMYTDDATFADLVQHEACGHGFAKLADEYESYNPGEDISADYNKISKEYDAYAKIGWYKNIDYKSATSEVKWSKYIGDRRYAIEGIGVYEGAGYYTHGAYRPTRNSLMRTLGERYNAPSREAIYCRINKLYYGDEWEYDHDAFVEQDRGNIAPHMPAPALSEPMEARFPTCPPVEIGMTWREYRKL